MLREGKSILVRMTYYLCYVELTGKNETEKNKIK